MYKRYRQLVIDGAGAARQLDNRVTSALAVGTHLVTITDVDVGVETARFRLANQFGEVHVEPVQIADSATTISWNLWRLLQAVVVSTEEVYRARRLILARPSILYDLVGVQLRIHLVHGPGYLIRRAITGRYRAVIMPDDTEIERQFDSYEEAVLYCEQAGHDPSLYRVGGWKPAGTPQFKWESS